MVKRKVKRLSYAQKVAHFTGFPCKIDKRFYADEKIVFEHTGIIEQVNCKGCLKCLTK